MATADVEHAANRDRVLTQETQYRCRIAEPLMRTLQLPVSPCYRVFGQGRIVEKLRTETTAQCPSSANRGRCSLGRAPSMRGMSGPHAPVDAPTFMDSSDGHPQF